MIEIRECTQYAELYKHRRQLEVRYFDFRKKRDCTICIVKTKTPISLPVTVKRVCAFVFTYADCCWFSYSAAQMFMLFAF